MADGFQVVRTKYEEFFIKNFTEKEPGMIEVTEFMEFFVKESNM